MPPTIAGRLCRLAPFALTCLALAGLPSVAVASPCASAQADLGATPAWQVRDETLSLINEERSSRGRGALELDDRLTLAARAHSCDMVTQRYFAHDSLSGRFLSGRIAATGWMDGRSGGGSARTSPGAPDRSRIRAPPSTRGCRAPGTDATSCSAGST